MDCYRKKLKTQNILYCIGAAALLVIQILAFTGVVVPVGTGERWHGFYNGFIAGAAMGVMILFVIGLIMNIRALHNETYMKKQYIKDNDERSIQIHAKGKSTGATIFMIIILPVAIILGYFNSTVFLSCIACELGLSLLIAFSKLYYSRKL